MTITYRIGFRDMLSFQAYWAPRNPIVMLMCVGFFILVTFQEFVPEMRQAPAGVPLAARVFGFILVELLLAVFIVAFLGVIIVLTMISGKSKRLYCQRTLTVGDDAFFTESEYGRSETKWSAVQKLVRTRSHIFMFMSHLNAVVIPRRAFEKVAEWDSFFETCKRGKSRVA